MKNDRPKRELFIRVRTHPKFPKLEAKTIYKNARAQDKFQNFLSDADPLAKLNFLPRLDPSNPTTPTRSRPCPTRKLRTTRNQPTHNWDQTLGSVDINLNVDPGPAGIKIQPRFEVRALPPTKNKNYHRPTEAERKLFYLKLGPKPVSPASKTY